MANGLTLGGDIRPATGLNDPSRTSLRFAPDVMTMRAPPDVPTPLWNLSNASERRALLADDGKLPVILAQAGAVAIPAAGSGVGAGSVSLDIAAIRAAASGIGPYAAIIGRLGVLSLPLLLSGDTPQPPAQDLKFGDLTLRLTAPAAFKEVGDPGTRAQFLVDKPGWFHFGSGQTVLNVPVTVQNGQARFDLGALERAYGKPLPPGIVAMAGRPAGVPAALQTTSSGITTAMAGAPDPCRNLPGQRHHIIPAEAMTANQAFLTRIGFVLDQPANMIKLPSNATQRNDMTQMCNETRPIHNGRHPQSYEQAVSEQLQGIESRLNAGSITNAEARGLVNELMSKVRAELTTGGYARINDSAVANFIRNLRL
jgi:A nuclease family of the HNH/ENDO VII superfamily with conserved AHH